MKNKRNLFILTLLLVTVFTSFSFVQAEEVENSSEKNSRFKSREHNIGDRKNEMQKSIFIKFDKEKIESIKQALSDRNYNTWIELVGSDCKMAEFINENNFNRFAEMHNLRKEGNFEDAKEIAEELGINFQRNKRQFKKLNKSWLDK